MASISPQASQRQGTPTRFFAMDPIKSIDQYMFARDSAYAVLVGKQDSKGVLPADYDVRPIIPADDLASANFATSSNYGGDWSVGSASLGTSTTGSVSAGGNTVLSGTMPQDRYMIFYGTEIQTPGTPPEVFWEFKNGANIKTVWLLQELLGFDRPRAIARQTPLWGPNDNCVQICGVVSQVGVVDAHLTLWGEPMGTTITAANVRA